MYIKNIKKDYGTTSKILVYNRGTEISPPTCKLHMQISCPECYVRSVNPIPSPSSLQRSKSMITDYTLANDFDLFCTFTYDPKKVDSFNVDEGKKVMSKWFNNERSRTSPDLVYLAVPELHKSGRIHFHALMKNYKGNLEQTNKQIKGREVFNLGKWNYGYSTAVKIDNIRKVSSYMQKYITKDMLKIGNKKRYFASRNLVKPKVDYNVNMIEEVHSRPLFVQGKFVSEYYKIYFTLN